MSARYHGGNLREAARLYGLPEEKFIDFSANINPLGPSPRVWPALQEALPKIVHYPCPEGKELKEKLAGHLGVPVEQVVLGNGGAELIHVLTDFFSPCRIVVPVPAFGEYGQGLRRPAVVQVKLEAAQGFRLDLTALAGVIQPGDLVFAGNPNNPTGVLTARDVILELAFLAARRGATLVVDEAFMDLVRDSQSVVKEVASCPALVVVGSLTKVFAIPGLRLGYLVARKDLARELEVALPPWRVNTLAQAAGLVSLADREHLAASREFIAREREFLVRSFRRLGFQVFPGEANFLLLNGRPVGITGEALQAFLGPRGVLVRLCDSFANLDEYYIRIAVRCRQDNEKLVSLVREFLRGGGNGDADDPGAARANGME